MNTTVHYITSQTEFNKLVLNRKLVAGGLYIVILDAQIHSSVMYFATSKHTYVSTSNSGDAGDDGVYQSSIPLIEKVGGLLKGADLSNITYSDLFTKIFYPNFDNDFPQKPVYLGFSEIYPTVPIIQSLAQIEDYSEFDYNSITTDGYVVIALPATWYLKRVEDSNGMNILGAFELIYKSVFIVNDYDIYNVYVTPKLHYNDELQLTLTTKTGTPVNVVLTSGIFEVNHIKPVINSLIITEGIKAIVNSLDISVRFEETVLNTISCSDANVEAVVNSLSIEDVPMTAQLLDMIVSQGTKSILNGITIEPGGDVTMISLVVSQGTPAILNNITISNLI